MTFSVKSTAYIVVVLFIVLFGALACKTKDKSENPNNLDKRTRWESFAGKDSAWYASERAIEIADNILLFQRNCGGWPKNMNMTKTFSKEEIKELIADKDKVDATIDNRASYPQVRFLGKVMYASKNMKYKDAFLKGYDYLIKSQYPNGGWPQFYPLHEGYYTHITFNDDAMTGVMYLLHDVVNCEPEFSMLDEQRKEQAALAIKKGLDIILKTQIKVDGHLTGWCAQYDENTLEPANARSYELISISGQETVTLIEYLMTLENPSKDVIDAVQSACAWLEKSKIYGYRMVHERDSTQLHGFNRYLVEDSTGTALWARFYDIQTNEPMYIDRGGIKKNSFNELSSERRNGYGYIGDFATTLLEKDYPAWKNKLGLQ